MGFCRTNLFKRLESSGHAFLQSIERHILRNYIFLHAIERHRPLPIGPQDISLLDSRVSDTDVEIPQENGESDGEEAKEKAPTGLRSESDFKRRAAEVYAQYVGLGGKRFKWLRPDLFVKTLTSDLHTDVQALLKLIQGVGGWDAAKDAKLNALVKLVMKDYPHEKILVFTQFADTVDYLDTQLNARRIKSVSGVTGESLDPTALAWRFSPVSNEKRDRIKPDDELRVLIATDVLSEGQNLQDCAIVVNYDLPWAIIRSSSVPGV